MRSGAQGRVTAVIGHSKNERGSEGARERGGVPEKEQPIIRPSQKSVTLAEVIRSLGAPMPADPWLSTTNRYKCTNLAFHRPFSPATLASLLHAVAAVIRTLSLLS